MLIDIIYLKLLKIDLNFSFYVIIKIKPIYFYRVLFYLFQLAI